MAFAGGPIQPVVLYDSNGVPVTQTTTKEQRSSTTTVTSVAASASNITLLAANANRLGATIYNDSAAILTVKLGATASSTSKTIVLADNSSGIGGYYEVPYGYTGQIDGFWASATGSARITELT